MRQRISVGWLLALLLSLCVLDASSALAQATNSAVLLSTNDSVQLSNSLNLSFPSNPSNGNTIVVMVVYTNSANSGAVSVSGLGASWATLYAPPFQSGLGIAFFSGTNVSGTQSAIIVNVPQADNLVVIAQAWQNLSTTVDPGVGSEAVASGQSQNPSVTVSTSNTNDVIFNVVGFLGTALPSPPSAGFLDMGLVPTGQFPPNVTGGLGIVDTAGSYTNAFSTNASVTWVSAAVALESNGISGNATFSATPLTDFSSGELYPSSLPLFPGMLYNDSNTPDALTDTAGRSAADAIVPLDRNGNVAADGKIGFVGIGGSNLTSELCTSNFITSRDAAQCDPNTFFDQANKLANINPSLVLADCAATGLTATNWLNVGSSGWSSCLGTRLPAYGLTNQQVEIVTINMDDGQSSPPAKTLSQLASGTTACPNSPVQGTDPDACVYEANLAILVPLLKANFPNLKQIFLEPRTYCGYGSNEPLCYENGFAIKWLVQSQVDEVEGTPNLAGANDTLAGNLNYTSTSTPWITWGPYLWGAGATPRLDGQTWPPDNFEGDGSTTSQCQYYGINCGRQHDADLMMAFYTSSPYTTPWFLTTPSTYKLSLSTNSITFEKRDVGLTGETTKARTITVSNPSGSKRPTITIGTATTTGDLYGNYQITSGGTCAAGMQLAPGKSCKITVTYTPLGPATSFGTLTIPNNGSKLETVALKGTATIADITVSPRTVNFAQTSPGSISSTKTVTLKNTNTVPLAIAPFILGGANPGDFTETSLCPQTLKAQNSCTISVTFKPTTTGSRKASIGVTASFDSVVVNLSGTGK